MIVKRYDGFGIDQTGQIVYDPPPQTKTFVVAPLGTVTGTRTAMTDLARGNRFIGPDGHTPYEVLIATAEDPRGWLQVRDLTKDHTYNEQEKAFDDEGFFAYSNMAATFVYRIDT